MVFPAARLVLDLGTSALPPDRGRAAVRLAAAGWTLAAYSPVDLERRPAEVGREIRALLDRLTPTRYP